MKPLFASVMILTAASLARGQNVLENVCGFPEEMIDYLHSNLGKSTGPVGARPLQGESGRTLYFFENGSWIVMYAFFVGPNSEVDKDVWCVVASGSREDADYDTLANWVNKTTIKALPTKYLRGLESSPGDLQILKNFRSSGLPAPSDAPPPQMWNT